LAWAWIASVIEIPAWARLWCGATIIGSRRAPYAAGSRLALALANAKASTTTMELTSAAQSTKS
jgi:hypothetical protein